MFTAFYGNARDSVTLIQFSAYIREAWWQALRSMWPVYTPDITPDTDF